MQTLRMIEENLKGIFYLSSFVITNIYLIKYLKKRKQLVQRHNNIIDKPIVTLDQAINVSKSFPSTESHQTYLVKAYPKSTHVEASIQNPVHSNQVYLVEPSLNKVASNVISLLNFIDLHKNDKDKNWQKQIKHKSLNFHRNWIAEFDTKFIKQTVMIEGYGEIIDHDIFDIKTKYKPIQDKGLIKTFLENIAYIFQFLMPGPNSFRADDLKRFSQNEDRAPFIKGPVIGSILYLFNFITDRPLLIEAKIQGNKIIPITLSSSKQKLLSSIDGKILLLNFKIIQCVVVSFLTYKLLKPHWNKLKKMIKQIGKLFFPTNPLIPTRHQTFKILQSSKIKDDLLCIVCYTNCRNTILFNCKHMIMCDDCQRNFMDKHCPICKNEIVQQKVLIRE